MNKEAKENKPFFNHIMTVSNHRPFTFPNDKIDIRGDAKSREGGVKYTDFAMKKFFEMAKTTVVLEYGLCYSSRSLCL
jgi:phosphoglycerol transferase MdoB-like AlkP superfamily enzyme